MFLKLNRFSLAIWMKLHLALQSRELSIRIDRSVDYTLGHKKTRVHDSIMSILKWKRFGRRIIIKEHISNCH